MLDRRTRTPLQLRIITVTVYRKVHKLHHDVGKPTFLYCWSSNTDNLGTNVRTQAHQLYTTTRIGLTLVCVYSSPV